MSTDRLEHAEEALAKMERQAEKEEREVHKALEEAKKLHKDHKEEVEKDKEFLKDIQNLLNEVDLLRQIDESLLNDIEEVKKGQLTKHKFLNHLEQKEEKFMEIRQKIDKELEDIVVELAKEKRLTETDRRLEEAEQRLARAIAKEQRQIEENNKKIAKALEIELK